MSNITKQVAKHFKEIHFGGNWTVSNIRDQLSDITWQEANEKVHDLNTIGTLTYHMSYYVHAVIKVLEGEALVAKDELSFKHPPIRNQQDWDTVLKNYLEAAEKMAELIEKLPEETLWEAFTDEKYGIYYRNLHGIIEHSHHHLGQIALIKKLVRQNK